MESHPQEQAIETDQDYDLKSIRLPRLAGRSLRLFIWLLENPFTRQRLLRRMLRDSGIVRLRRRIFTEAPLFQPYPSAGPVSASAPHSPFSLAPALEMPRQNRPGLASVLDYTWAYRSGLTTPENVAQRLLAAIAASDAHNPPLRAFIAWNRDDLLRQAQASGQRWLDGRPLGPFDGVPVAVKDELDQLPYPTTLGTRFLSRPLTGEDATVVARLRAAGALLIGKTNMHEFGAGVTGLNLHYGSARNPYRLDYHTGGSSSGSAAAVAAGLCPVAIGVDGGGSIRIPAAFCGVVGLKPSYGRVSSFGGADQGFSVCQPGPIAATARDAALAYALIAGPDPRDRKSLAQPPVTLAGFGKPDLRGLTLGVYWPWFEHATPAVVAVCKSLLYALQAVGAQLKEIRIPELDSVRIAHTITILSEMAVALEPLYADHRRDFGPDVRATLAVARCLSARDYIQAQQVRARLIERLKQAFQTADVIVTPATGCSAPPLQRRALRQGALDLGLLTEIMRFTLPANLAGLPAISFPAGYDPSGLPVGFQAMGRPWEEHVLLRLAHVAENIVERRPTQLHYSLLSESRFSG